MSYKFNPFTSNFDIAGAGSAVTYLPTVPTEADLPLSDPDGAVRVVLATNRIYVFDLGTTKWYDPALIADDVSGSGDLQGISFSEATDGDIIRPTAILHPATASTPGVVTAQDQIFAGAKTFQDDILVDGGIDVNDSGGTDTLNIGFTNADIINIGRSGATINVIGDTFYQNVTNLNVADKNITVNVGGSAGSASAAGIDIEENAIVTGYVNVSSDRNGWLLKAPNTAGEATIIPGASGIILNQSSHNPVTLAAVGSSPNANAATLTGQALNLQPADATNPGVVSTTTQTFAGAKTFSGTVAASNLSGTNTGDQTITLSGDVIGTGTGSFATTINTHAVSNVKLASMPATTIKGNDTGGSADAADLSIAQVQSMLSIVVPVPGDLKQASFTAADNQSSPAVVTGLTFSNTTVRSFEAIVSIVRNTTYAQYRLNGIQKASTWEMTQDYVGDDTGLTFSINTFGVMLYTSTSTGSTALLKFRAQVTSV